MDEEIELKLAVAPNAGATLRRDPLLVGAEGGGTRRLFSVYYDTPDHALRKLGVGLRVRKAGRRFLQTIKLPSGRGAALHRHHEVETALPDERFDLESIPDAGLRRIFTKHRIATGLAPIFATEIRRTLWTFRHAGAVIELALDRGEIQADGRVVPVSEIELELKGGKAAGLYRTALALSERLPVRIEWRTKSARGYALGADALPAATRGQPIHLDPTLTPTEAFGAIARVCISQLGQNEVAALDGHDIEGVHQMRVALRRLRSLVGAYRHQMSDACHGELSRDLRWLQQSLSPARDWDVLLAYTLPPLRRRLPEEAALFRLEALAEARRAAAYEVVRETVGSPRYTALLLNMGLLLETGRWVGEGEGAATLTRPVRRFADGLLDKRHRRLRKLGRRKDLSENELHRLRLFGKKMRYVADFFRSLYPPKATQAYILALSELQERLGSLNDAVVTDMLLAELPGDEDERLLLGHARALLRGWQAHAIEIEHKAFAEVWKRFDRRKPFWRKG